MATDSPDSAFVVELTGLAREQLREIVRRAINTGRADAVVQAYESILSRLRADARAVGDPLYRFRGIRMDVLHFVDPPLYVQYGIPDARRVAIIRRFLRMSGPPS